MKVPHFDDNFDSGRALRALNLAGAKLACVEIEPGPLTAC
jgi:hypothetical protein